MDRRDRMLLDFTEKMIRKEKGDFAARSFRKFIQENITITMPPKADNLTDQLFLLQLKKEWPYFRDHCLVSIIK